jgi:hypothetical protein
MARQVVVRLSCDICQSEENVAATEFAFGRSAYEIDLCAAHQQALTEATAPFVTAARKARTRASAPTSMAPTSNRAVTRRDPAQTEAIRSWAKANGHAISSRGRIPAAIEAAYNAK